MNNCPKSFHASGAPLGRAAFRRCLNLAVVAKHFLICQYEVPTALQQKKLWSYFVFGFSRNTYFIFLLSLFRTSSRNIPILNRQTQPMSCTKRNSKTPKPSRVPPNQPAKPTVTASLPLRLLYATPLALWSSPNKTSQGGEKIKGRIRWAGHFSDRLELIKTTNTSLSAKLVFLLVETSGQDKVFLNEPADQLFYFLCYFSCCVIDFIWALQIFFCTLSF